MAVPPPHEDEADPEDGQGKGELMSRHPSPDGTRGQATEDDRARAVPHIGPQPLEPLGRGWGRRRKVVDHLGELPHGLRLIGLPYPLLQLIRRQASVRVMAAKLLDHRLAVLVRRADLGRPHRPDQGVHG
jgi:hypothetical protein